MTKLFLGSVGKPFPGVQIKIKPDGQDPNEGELYVKGPQIFKRYYNRPKVPRVTRPNPPMSRGPRGLMPSNFLIVLRKPKRLLKMDGLRQETLFAMIL